MNPFASSVDDEDLAFADEFASTDEDSGSSGVDGGGGAVDSDEESASEQEEDDEENFHHEVVALRASAPRRGRERGAAQARLEAARAPRALQHRPRQDRPFLFFRAVKFFR